MACIEKIYSVSAVIGNGACNGNCSFCAGKYLRPQVSDSPLYWKNYASAIKLCARYGGWSLSLTGSGEPTVDPNSVTKALEIYSECAAQGAYLLRKGEVEDYRSYRSSIKDLIFMGSNNITSWPVGNPDGSRNEYTPSRLGLASIRLWLKWNAKLCHGHVWGGGVYDYNGAILRMTDYVTKHDPNQDFVRQLVVFQDATVAYSWIREGALCMK